MAPSGIERIDNRRGLKQFENRLHPADITLSAAMATSAAVVSFHMGEYTLEPLQTLQVMLGIGMGASLKAEPKSRRGFLAKVRYIFYNVMSL